MGHAVKVYAASCFSSATLLISARHLRVTRVTRPFNHPRIFRGGERGGRHLVFRHFVPHQFNDLLFIIYIYLL